MMHVILEGGRIEGVRVRFLHGSRARTSHRPYYGRASQGEKRSIVGAMACPIDSNKIKQAHRSPGFLGLRAGAGRTLTLGIARRNHGKKDFRTLKAVHCDSSPARVSARSHKPSVIAIQGAQRLTRPAAADTIKCFTTGTWTRLSVPAADSHETCLFRLFFGH